MPKIVAARSECESALGAVRRGRQRPPAHGSVVRPYGGAVVYRFPAPDLGLPDSGLPDDEPDEESGRLHLTPVTQAPATHPRTRPARIPTRSSPIGTRGNATTGAGERPRTARAGAGRRKYFWRRLLAISLVALAGAILWSSVDRILASASPRLSPNCSLALAKSSGATLALASARSGAASAARATLLSGSAPDYCNQIYVVRPGDTIWGIAERYSGPGSDPRALADQLQAQVGGTVLQPGQRLAVP